MRQIFSIDTIIKRWSSDKYQHVMLPALGTITCGNVSELLETTFKTGDAEWKIARTYAHLHVNGRYTGISVSMKHSWASDDPELLIKLSLPPLPKKVTC